MFLLRAEPKLCHAGQMRWLSPGAPMQAGFVCTVCSGNPRLPLSFSFLKCFIAFRQNGLNRVKENSCQGTSKGGAAEPLARHFHVLGQLRLLIAMLHDY